MPDKTPTPKPVQPSEHEDARHQAQIEKMQAAFAANLVEAFRTLVVEASHLDESSLGTLTIVQMDELLNCLRTTVTTPPPEGGTPFIAAPPTEEPVG